MTQKYIIYHAWLSVQCIVNENFSYDNPILRTSHFFQHFDVFIVFSHHIKRHDKDKWCQICYLWRLFRSTFLIMTYCWNVLPTETIAVCRQCYEERQLTWSCLSVRVSLHPHEPLRSHSTDFHEMCYLNILLKTCRENSSFINMWQEQRVIYMKTDTRFWSYLAQFFLEWELYRTDVVEQIKTHILCSITFFRKSCRLWDSVEKYFRAGPATDDDIIGRMHIACWVSKATNIPLEYVMFTVFPRQQWLRERTSMLPLNVHRPSY